MVILSNLYIFVRIGLLFIKEIASAVTRNVYAHWTHVGVLLVVARKKIDNCFSSYSFSSQFQPGITSSSALTQDSELLS